MAAKLDYERWRQGEYDPALMGEILAWYDMTRLIDAHVEDAKALETKRQSRKKKPK